MTEITSKDDASRARIRERICEIWSEVLGVKVGMHETFFDLGGDSIGAMLCISRLRDAFGIEFPVDDFLSGEGTVASLAEKIDGSKALGQG